MKSFKKILFTAIICYLNIVTYAQTDSMPNRDSVSISTYEEPLQTSSFTKRERFKYLKRSMIEEPSMFKIAALPYFSGYYGGGAFLGFGYEKKIGPSFSVAGELANYINLFPTHVYETQYKGSVRTGLNASIRYYYGQKKEIQKGVSGNNLLSNYFEIKAEDVLTYWRVKEAGESKKTFWVNPNLVLAWGMQRRIGKLGYFDVSFGAKILSKKFYPESRITPYVKIAIGLGFSSKQSKKRK